MTSDLNLNICANISGHQCADKQRKRMNMRILPTQKEMNRIYFTFLITTKANISIFHFKKFNPLWLFDTSELTSHIHRERERALAVPASAPICKANIITFLLCVVKCRLALAPAVRSMFIIYGKIRYLIEQTIREMECVS